MGPNAAYIARKRAPTRASSVLRINLTLILN
jgi:hypothetical protein